MEAAARKKEEEEQAVEPSRAAESVYPARQSVGAVRKGRGPSAQSA